MTPQKLDMDVVVCTKNRHELLKNLLKQISMYLSYNSLVIIDSSDVPFNFEQSWQDQVIYVYNPAAKLGLARQLGLEKCSSKYVFFVDDKVVLSPSSVSVLYNALENSGDPSIVAVSGKMIHGYNNPVLKKLFSSSTPFLEGENGGFVLLKRKEVLEIGGFNKKIHWGEDVELRQRLNANGLKWILVPDAVASHRSSFADALATLKRHGRGCRTAVILGGSSFKMATRLFGRTLLMPLYYGFKTKDPRVFGYYSLMNCYLLYGFLKG